MQTLWTVAAIVVALIWAMVILLASSAQAGLPQADSIMQTLVGGAAACTIMLGGLETRARNVH